MNSGVGVRIVRSFVASLLLAQTSLFAGCGGAAKPSTQPLSLVAPVDPIPVLVSGAEPDAPLYVAGHVTAAVPVTRTNPTWGNVDAPVTVVEFSDFECPFCQRAVATLEQIKKAYGPTKVRIVFKDNPLPFHSAAKPAHIAAATVYALGGANAFWKFHDRAFANSRELTEQNFEIWATQAGVNVQLFRNAYSSKRYAPQVESEMALAAKLGANGVPAFRINGVTLNGAQPFEKFKEVIDAQLAEAEKLRAAGVKAEDIYVALTNKNIETPPKPAPAEAEDKSVWKVPVYSDDPVRGPKDALVTIVQFSEFQCPFCKRVEATLNKILAEYPKEVRVVWKDNPLPFHPRATPAAILSRMAYQQKGSAAFWQIHDALFASQPKLEDEDLKTIAEQVGLDWKRASAAIAKNPYATKLDQSVELAADLQARGTPHFFINGVRLSGAQPYENFKALIDEQLQKARELSKEGVVGAKVYERIIKEGKEPPPPAQKQAPAVDAKSPVKGSRTAKVLIQVWSDFQCPFCERVNATLLELEKEFPRQIAIVWRHLPLGFHEDAELAAEAAEEVFRQKGDAGFWKYHDKLFAAQKEEGGLERPNLEKFALELGVDMVKFRNALDSSIHKPRVEADSALAEKLSITGTPGFLINDYFLSGAQPAAAFKKLIRRALKDQKNARNQQR